MADELDVSKLDSYVVYSTLPDSIEITKLDSYVLISPVVPPPVPIVPQIIARMTLTKP